MITPERTLLFQAATHQEVLSWLEAIRSSIKSTLSRRQQAECTTHARPTSAKVIRLTDHRQQRGRHCLQFFFGVNAFERF